MRALRLLAILLLALPGAVPAQRAPGPDYRFVVVGHIRGKDGALSPRLAELIADLRALKPDLVLLPGDIIWGDVQRYPVDSAQIEAEWNAVDSAFAPLRVPLIRAPGNHDINDRVTREIWRRRYGQLPKVVRFGTSRFIVVSSAWIPGDNDSIGSKRQRLRGVDLDSAQVGFLRRELALTGGARHTFVVMHHLLWWNSPESGWWREVHPLLAGAGVRAVFTGDYGPMKFSHLERDGVQYYQNSLELPVPLVMLQNNIRSRLLTSQFDNYLEVNVRGDAVRYTVRTLAAESSGEFTPDRWRAINQPPGPEPSLWNKVVEFAGGRRRLAMAFMGVVLGVVAGVWLGRRTA